MVEQVQRELYPERHFLCVFNTLVMMTMRIIMMIMMLLLVMNQCFEKSPGIQLEVGSLVLVEAAVRMVEEQMRKMGGSQMRLSLVPLQRRLVWGRRWTVERKRRGRPGCLAGKWAGDGMGRERSAGLTRKRQERGRRGARR